MFSDKFKSFTAKNLNIFSSKKKLWVITVLGIVGVLLIGVSELFTNNDSDNKYSKSNDTSVTQYIKILENKTEKMLREIDGAGKSKIMITAEASAMQDYAIDENFSDDIQTNEDEKRIKKESQTEIVMVEGESGRKQALVERIIEPQIRGVLVLCEGADDVEINEKITSAVKTVLGVPSNKICVIKIKK